MLAVEFETQIKDGIIEIPVEYQQRLRQQGAQGWVRVLILTPERQPAENMVAYLIAHPLVVEGFQPLRREEIYDRGAERNT